MFNQFPPNLLEYVATEEHQFLVSLVRCKQEFDLFNHLDYAYRLAFNKKCDDFPVHGVVVLDQLYPLTHHCLLFSFSTMMRCHLAESYSCMRVAIDAALVAHYVIRNPDSCIDYMNRKKPFDKLTRYYKNLIKNQAPSVHDSLPFLIDKIDQISQYMSHADFSCLIHRFEADEDGTNRRFNYFQFNYEDIDANRFYYLIIIEVFSHILLIFKDFVQDEIRIVGNEYEENVKSVLIKCASTQKHFADTQKNNDRVDAGEG